MPLKSLIVKGEKSTMPVGLRTCSMHDEAVERGSLLDEDDGPPSSAPQSEAVK